MNKDLILAQLQGKLEAYDKVLKTAKGKTKNDLTIRCESIRECMDLVRNSGQGEQLKCQCKKAQFTRTVDADFNPLCGRCGKAL